MKKILITLLIFVASFSYSQNQYHIYKVRSGPYNQYTKEYDLRDNYVSIGMVFDNSVVRIFDEARSVYITRNYREIKNDYTGTIAKWDGVDEKGRSVGIFMAYNKQSNESSIAVVYNDFMFQYFFNE